MQATSPNENIIDIPDAAMFTDLKAGLKKLGLVEIGQKWVTGASAYGPAKDPMWPQWIWLSSIDAVSCDLWLTIVCCRQVVHISLPSASVRFHIEAAAAVASTPPCCSSLENSPPGRALASAFPAGLYNLWPAGAELAPW